MKKDDSPAISLFSFQDIITSLTGIMFLIVLLLIIFMMDMTPKKDNQVSPAVKEAVREAENLRKELDAIKKRDEHLKERIAELKKLNLKVLPFRVDLQKQKNTKLQESVNILKQDLALKKTEKEGLKKNTDMLLKRIREQTEKQKILTAEKEKLTKLLVQNRTQWKTLKNTVRFTVENSSGSAPVLVECSADGIQILDYTTAQKTDLRDKNGTPVSRKAAFLNWVRNRSGKNEYYTILIKPESFEYADLILYLGNMGKSRGLEFMQEDSMTIF